MMQLVAMTSSGKASGKASEAMEHHEAIEMMASERYLLDELNPELRDAYEDHMFGCIECAADLKLSAAFVDHAKAILPTMAAVPVRTPAKVAPEKRDWFAWLRPAIMVPAFACLLAIVGYQNVVTYPSLQAAATEPRILPAASVLAGATRSGVPVLYGDLLLGTTLTVPLPPGSSYGSYKFDIYNSQSKLIWTRVVPMSSSTDDSVTLWLPGRVKQDTYKLAISGVSPTGENIPLEQRIFDLQIKK